MPIERAVPATCCLAASRSLALRSGILILAISATWASVTVPTSSRPGVCRALLEPGRLAQQHRRRRRLEDERERAVLEDRDLDGDDRARWASVAALYALQKSMIATPWGPSAVPTGGRGRGLPGRDLDLDDGRDLLLGHDVLFLLDGHGQMRSRERSRAWRPG